MGYVCHYPCAHPIPISTHKERRKEGCVDHLKITPELQWINDD